MPVVSTMSQKPQREDVSVGTYAIRVGEETHVIWKRKKDDDPFSNELYWEKVGERDATSIPKSDYSGGSFAIDTDNDVWFYVEEIEPREDTRAIQTTIQQDIQNEPDYALTVYDSESQEHHVTGSTQAAVFAKTIEVLIEEYNLLSHLRLPWVPGHKNAIINDEPNHPSGEEMGRFQGINDGYYVYTSPMKQQKMEYITELVSRVPGVSAEFRQGWKN